MKECFKCHAVLPLTEFYKNCQMPGGILNKCKDCSKKDTKEWYAATATVRAAYERVRCKDPARKAKAAEYQRRQRAKNPEKSRARALVGYAVKSGKIQKQPCKCGETKVQAHHHDYSKPLDVQWMCFKCHREEGHDQKTYG